MGPSRHFYSHMDPIWSLLIVGTSFVPWVELPDARASINTPNIGKSALIIEELDWGGQDALNTCENSFFGHHLGLGRQKNVVRLGQTPDVEPPY